MKFRIIEPVVAKLRCLLALLGQGARNNFQASFSIVQNWRCVSAVVCVFIGMMLAWCSYLLVMG